MGRYILILVKTPTQGLHDTALTAEALYPINFAKRNETFALSLHYSGSSSFFFVTATKIYQFKARNSEIKNFALCLGNILKDSTINNFF